MNKQKKAFTLVELIVVITILAILGTIAFISLNGYSKTARDSTRISDLSTMKTSLELFNLDAGKYPETTDPFNVTYSGVTIWTQGEFGDSTTNNVDRLDKIPTDPLTERKYTYSITKTKQEYQLAGLLEGDDVVLNLTEEVNAGDLVATAIVTGNYNGMMLKTLTGGVNCEILAIPSIISNQPSSVTQLTTILSNTGLVYDRKNNLPSNYISSKFKVDEGFDFIPNQLVVYSDSNSCNPIYDEDDATQRIVLVTNLQTAYTGTVIADEGTITDITIADSGEIANMASSIVNNNLGGEVAVNEITLSCNDSSKPADSGHITYIIGYPSFENQNYVKDSLNCGYSCTDSYTGIDCDIVPNPAATCTSGGQILNSTTTYGSCNTNDIIVCTGNSTGYVISACNIGTNIAGTSSSSYGLYFQWGNNAGTPYSGFSRTASRPSDVSSYGPLNYYDSSPYFIDGDIGYWSGNSNSNLWGNVTNTFEARQGPCETGYHIPSQLEINGIRANGGTPNVLSMPMAKTGFWSDGHIHTTYGYYWTSTNSGNFGIQYAFSNMNTFDAPGISYPAERKPIRCFKN